MSKDQITATFTCPKCGPTSLHLPDEYTDDSIASCNICGQEFGRYGDIKEKVIDMAKAEVDKIVESALGAKPKWTQS
jgi:transcription elongation factor Elf1